MTVLPARLPEKAPGSALIRVMVCDDSVVVRAALSRILESDPDVRVIARASNGQMALDTLRHQSIDVVVLDVEMPVMDGITALPLLMQAEPGLRIIVTSSVNARGAVTALRALSLGAADYLPKPEAQNIGNGAFGAELLAKVRGHARLRDRARLPLPSPASVPVKHALRPAGKSPELVAIGSSTGGPQALFTLVQGLAAAKAALHLPFVLTQHTQPGFTSILAEHITGLGGPPCREAQDGQRLLPGCIHLAPGNRHLLVARHGGVLIARLSDGEPENFCRPAVDPMLRSASEACVGRVLAVILTGMGQDGLLGTRALIEAGGTAIAQDEATSVVWGMPGAVARAGLCHAVLPMPDIATKLLDLIRKRTF